MNEKRIAGQRLLQLAEPFLMRSDRDGLAAAIADSWNADCLSLLLDEDEIDSEVLRVAIICIGLVGNMDVCPALMPLLHHDDIAIVSATEDALWSIWFRAGEPIAQRVLSRIAGHIRAKDTENVIEMLTDLIRSQVNYAEAYHQRSQAHYLEGHLEAALRDAKRAYQLNPYHFGALANIGNCYCELGRYQEAIKAYRDVLDLHPHMPEIKSTLRHLRSRIAPSDPTATHLTLATDPD